MFELLHPNSDSFVTVFDRDVSVEHKVAALRWLTRHASLTNKVKLSSWLKAACTRVAADGWVDEVPDDVLADFFTLLTCHGLLNKSSLVLSMGVERVCRVYSLLPDKATQLCFLQCNGKTGAQVASKLVVENSLLVSDFSPKDMFVTEFAQAWVYFLLFDHQIELHKLPGQWFSYVEDLPALFVEYMNTFVVKNPASVFAISPNRDLFASSCVDELFDVVLKSSTSKQLSSKPFQMNLVKYLVYSFGKTKQHVAYLQSFLNLSTDLQASSLLELRCIVSSSHYTNQTSAVMLWDWLQANMSVFLEGAPYVQLLNLLVQDDVNVVRVENTSRRAVNSLTPDMLLSLLSKATPANRAALSACVCLHGDADLVDVVAEYPGLLDKHHWATILGRQLFTPSVAMLLNAPLSVLRDLSADFAFNMSQKTVDEFSVASLSVLNFVFDSLSNDAVELFKSLYPVFEGSVKQLIYVANESVSK